MSVATLEQTAAEAAAPKAEEAEKLVIIACSGEHDKIWPALILATAGAAMGKDTMIFFTFWGLFSLVKDDVRITGENWMQKMMSLINRGGAGHMKLSKMSFGGAGKAMMMHIAKEHHAAGPQELLEVARDLGVRLVPCQMTLELMGLRREDLIDGLEEPAGAAYMLGEAQGATTFFI